MTKKKVALCLTLPFAASLAACAAGDPLVATEVAESGPRTLCTSRGVDEWISFGLLNAQIAANPGLPARTGIAHVETCEQAHAHVQAVNALEEDGAPVDPFPGEASEGVALTPYVKGGTASSGYRGMVWLSGGLSTKCTGWLLNSKVVVTAASCVAYGSSTGVKDLSVTYFDPDTGSKRVLTDGEEPLQVRLHGGWTGDYDDAAKNLAVVVRKDGWKNVQAKDFLRIFEDTLSDINPVRMWGAGYDTFSGTGFGDLEWLDKDIEWYGSEHYFVTGGPKGRLCQGDTGGPSIVSLDGVLAVTGVHASWETSSAGNLCAKKHGKMRDVRFTPSNVGWLREAAGDALGTGPISCSKLTAGGHDYWHCP